MRTRAAQHTPAFLFVFLFFLRRALHYLSLWNCEYTHEANILLVSKRLPNLLRSNLVLAFASLPEFDLVVLGPVHGDQKFIHTKAMRKHSWWSVCILVQVADAHCIIRILLSEMDSPPCFDGVFQRHLFFA